MKTKIVGFSIIALIMMGCNAGKRTSTTTVESTTETKNPITEKYWKLTILEGNPIEMSENQEREISFTLRTNENRVTGFAGCNAFSGNYTLEKGQRIRFLNMLSTLKSCPDVDFNESNFLKIFDLADNYTIVDDVLSLNVGRRAPLAVFEAVYFN